METLESKELRSVMEAFLEERFEAKTEKVAADDPKRDSLAEQFQRENWLSDAARRVGQLQVVTHSLKPIHPDAKGSSLYVPPDALASPPLVGSHLLSGDFAEDVVGNAAALDIYKFLKLEHAGRSLLERVLDGDADLAAAMSDDPEQARQWMVAFAGITQPRGGEASHTNAKQLYWLVGDDPTNNDEFHILAPLYATSLEHRFHQAINEDRFGDAAREARHARREERYAESGYRDYPDLAVQKLGGTKPQNISQLNSERGGNNYLLASLPPVWHSSEIKPPLFTDTVFHRFGRRKGVRWQVAGLRQLLGSDPARNYETRNRRDEYVATLIDELIFFAGAHAALEPGWSASSDCRLPESEALWLDARRDDEDFVQRREDGDWAQEIRHRFATWLNNELRKELPVSDPEYESWRSQLKKRLDGLEEDLPYV